MKSFFTQRLRAISLILVVGLLVLLAGGVFYLIFIPLDCSQFPAGQLMEVENIPIALTDPLSRRSAEISGMDWYGDTLVILPQYFNHAVGRVVYAIPKSVILDYLANPGSPPIEPIRIPVEDQRFGEDFKTGFEGYEAIAFMGDQIFLTVEVSTKKGMVGYLISGEIQPDLSRVVLEPQNRQKIPLQQQLDNTTNETLLSTGSQIVTLFEANGAVINPTPAAQIYDPALNLVGELPFPTIEYRITDATQLDEAQNFWVLNIYSVGTTSLKPQKDLLAAPGDSICVHPFYAGVERLVEMHYDPSEGITLTGRAPLVLARNGNLISRNWEGLVRLDDLGFLIASDKYPDTTFAFVPLP